MRKSASCVGADFRLIFESVSRGSACRRLGWRNAPASVVWINNRVIGSPPMGLSMAKRKSRSKGMKMQPAVSDLYFTIPAGGRVSGESLCYIDTARELSKINRRLYSQSRMYGFQGLTFIWRSAATVAGPPIQTLSTIEVKVKTAGNTWSVQNAHVKGEALWNQMQALVLEDNPSIAGKWHDFKVRLDYNMTAGRQLKCQDGMGVEVAPGEWDYSTYVMPEHSVDAAGNPLVAAEFLVSLIGEDTTLAGPPVTGNRSLVKAYQESRATVQPTDPNVPAGMETSFFNLLTDSGSQEPELALVIQDEGDRPPYDDDDYVGGDVNAINPLIVGYAAISSSEVDGRIGGFIAPCGLLQLEVVGYDQDGNPWDPASMPEIDILLHVAPGSYKGVAAIPMGQ